MIDSLENDGGSGKVDLKKSRRKKLSIANPLKIDRIPPHSIEAEQGVLGCVLLSPNECLGECVEKLKGVVEIFYDLRHQALYETLQEMYDKRQPIDLITLQENLKNKNQLEGVGGLAYLASLPDAVPSAANLSYYIEIVREKYILRQMIHTCTEVVGRAYEHEGEVEALLDEVEKNILHIGQERTSTGSAKIKDLVHSAITKIEEYHQNQGMLTGISTGFPDFDKMTTGLHGGEMIIVAARPSMGKCLAADSEILLANGEIATIKEIYKSRKAKLLTLEDDFKIGFTKPSAFVDDALKPVFRVTTGLGRTVEATMPHPFLTIDGWKQLGELKAGDRIAVPRKLEVFGSDVARECEVKLLAYLIGDGCLTHSCPTFTNSNVVLREDFSKAVKDFGGMTVRYSDSQATRTPYLRVVADREFIAAQRGDFGSRLRSTVAAKGRSSRSVALAMQASPVSFHEWKKGNCVPGAKGFMKLCSVLQSEPSELAPYGIEAISKNGKNSVVRWLQKMELWGKGAKGKTIPAAVFKWQRSQVALLLNRLFATDGWATVLASGSAQLGYATVSEKLARQTQHLLLRFGIIASLRKRGILYKGERRPAWQLDITDSRSIQKFASQIGIFGKEKAVTAVKSALEKRNYQSNCDLIPREIWKQIASAKGNEPWAALARRAGIEGHTNIHVGKRALTRDRLLVLAKALKSSFLRDVAESDVYWDRIVSIEPVGLKQVYDLTIPETHNFIANDICVHNTSLAMNIAESVAIDQKLPVGVFSLEMTAESLVLRMLCSRSRVNLRNIREGFLAERDFPKLTGAAGKLAGSPLYIDDTSGLSILQLRAKARRMHQQHGIKLFVIDYLQLLNSTSRRAENRQQEIADISNGVKALAKELNVPVIILAQLNRDLEKRGPGERPRLSDLRESGSIEQDADLVALLFKESQGKDDDEPSFDQEAVPVKLFIAKQRNGPTGDVDLTFLKSYTRFESAAKVSSDDVPTGS